MARRLRSQAEVGGPALEALPQQEAHREAGREGQQEEPRHEACETAKGAVFSTRAHRAPPSRHAASIPLPSSSTRRWPEMRPAASTRARSAASPPSFSRPRVP